MRAAAALATALATLLAGCGASIRPLPASCSDGPQYVMRALRRAPGPVRLVDGTPLSQCAARASTDGEVQLLGFALTPVADRLAEETDPMAALRLGYLVGAVRRGAAGANGVQEEMVRRLEHTITYRDPALLAAARRGLHAGEAGG